MERRGDPGMGQAAPEEKEKYSATLRMPTQERGSATIARRPRQHSDGCARVSCPTDDLPNGSQHAAERCLAVPVRVVQGVPPGAR
jgi:hypothetical protein